MAKKFDWKWSSLIVVIVLNSLFGAMKFGEMKKEIEIQSRTDTELKYAVQALTTEIKSTRETLCELKGQIKIK